MLPTLFLSTALFALAGPTGDDVAAYQERRGDVLIEAGGRHLELGLWAREKGLVPQATSELFLAVEASEGTHYGASKVLSLMRSLDDAFWKQRRPRPSRSTVKIYDTRARKALKADQEARLGLAAWAQKRDLDEQARDEYLAILRQLDAPLDFDAGGRIVLEYGEIPAPVATWIRESAVAINGREYLRDEFLAHLPEVGEIFEVGSDVLRVRVTTSPADAAALHALGEALVPILEQDLGGRPTRRMNVFVFGERAQYEAYLDAAGFSAQKVVSGFASSGTFTAVVEAEGASPEVVQALVLHELTHLFGMGISRGVLPSWYGEGLAEVYGGQGTFAFDGTVLETGKHLAAHELELLRDPALLMPLSELVRTDALALWSQDDKTAAWRFYAQSWAFVRFLRRDASVKHRELFADWEARCLGAALGADAQDAGKRDAKPAQQLFLEMFAGELDRLESDYRAYLRNLF